MRKIPRVGQKVNLNSFECYIAVKKVAKPLEFADNVGTVSKDKSIELIQDIEKSKQLSHSMTYRESTQKLFPETEQLEQSLQTEST